MEERNQLKMLLERALLTQSLLAHEVAQLRESEDDAVRELSKLLVTFEGEDQLPVVLKTSPPTTEEELSLLIMQAIDFLSGGTPYVWPNYEYFSSAIVWSASIMILCLVITSVTMATSFESLKVSLAIASCCSILLFRFALSRSRKKMQHRIKALGGLGKWPFTSSQFFDLYKN